MRLNSLWSVKHFELYQHEKVQHNELKVSFIYLIVYIIPVIIILGPLETLRQTSGAPRGLTLGTTDDLL